MGWDGRISSDAQQIFGWYGRRGGCSCRPFPCLAAVAGIDFSGLFFLSVVAAVDALVVERVDQQGYSAQCASTNNFWLPKILDQHPRLVLFSTFFF